MLVDTCEYVTGSVSETYPTKLVLPPLDGNILYGDLFHVTYQKVILLFVTLPISSSISVLL